ncbi:Di-sulfide bridge nucleocytoplasmic transport domain-containing protein [Mycotypha africana]|uniref:Di-sulfide bridge nucleocytoplasmic transport domain-containing protein n=1 Tax=Mycotypha africana TaxID=64632 RepID=UPI0023005F66|nr:Di-sulfide bridge nucleocytoplasmic transport domain-containing protein [Mycotypha africana]KAI8988268.1 Di-sulfide bridge nucleocytoplasmic transport domain-containing protein [Mycotypha africana]
MSSNNGKKPTAIYESRFLKHQDITYTIVLYIQTLFNIICSFCIFYIFVNIILSIKQDFKLKTEEHIHALHEERMSCTNSFIANRCADSDRVPAIENLCNQWASCMNRDTAVAQ